ncbi:MAG: hypothetical protein ABIW46_02490 [Acidimicrobiales bacterium]
MTLRDWLVENPPPPGSFSQTLAGVASRSVAGEPFLACVRELLDEVALLVSEEQYTRVVTERPPPTGDRRRDAYLGALAEHLAGHHGVERPVWACEPDRFLDRFWFVSEVSGFRALAIAESPAAFRRRGIFISAASLRRC